MSINYERGLDHTFKILSLYEVTNLIKSSLLELTKQKIWVQAHLHVNRAGLKGGHFYCDLVDVDERGNQMAKLRGTIWSSRYKTITKKLQDAGYPKALMDNSEICVLCSIRYHELYGLSLDILDVDPTFGEAQINRNRRLIIEQLTKEGILKKNALVYLPAAALKIGLISSKDSAAYHDFVKTLFDSKYSFKIIFAEASMQGEKTEKDVISAIDLLEKINADIICIIRGGGSQADLASFDNENIARRVINCSAPIWVGIGHEIDVGVLDVVAHSAHKTPTAVAETLITRLDELSASIEVAHDRMKHNTERMIALQESSLQRNVQAIINGLKNYFTLVENKIKNYTLLSESKFVRIFSEKENILIAKSLLIKDKSLTILKDRERELASNQTNLKSLTDDIYLSKAKSIQEKIDKLIPSTRRYVQKMEVDLKRNIHGASIGLHKYYDLIFERFEKKLVLTDSKVMKCFTDRVSKLDQLTKTLQYRFSNVIIDNGKLLYEKTVLLSSLCGHYETDNQKQIADKTQRLNNIYKKFTRSQEKSISVYESRFQLSRYMKIISDKENTLNDKIQRLNSLKPENVLKRGYSITRDDHGQVIKSINQIDQGQAIVTQYSDGYSESIVSRKGE